MMDESLFGRALEEREGGLDIRIPCLLLRAKFPAGGWGVRSEFSRARRRA